jgi:hypothetical protein
MVNLVTMGFFDVPTVERKPWGILALVLNILPAPGVGSIIAGAKAGDRTQIIKGVLQILFVWTIIAFVWAVIDGVRIFRASTVGGAASPSASARSVSDSPAPAAPKTAGSDYQPQCAALTEDGSQCRNSARGKSRYCASHKGYQPPTAKGLAKRIEGEDWSDEDKTTDRQSVSGADTKPAVGKAPDTRMKVRKAAKKAPKKAAKKAAK